MEYLSIKRIWHMRQNSGAVVSEYNGKKRMIRYGRTGCADILASPLRWEGMLGEHPVLLWLEIKADKGRQSPGQIQFMDEVRNEGHYYAVIHSIEELQDVLKEIRG